MGCRHSFSCSCSCYCSLGFCAWDSFRLLLLVVVCFMSEAPPCLLSTVRRMHRVMGFISRMIFAAMKPESWDCDFGLWIDAVMEREGKGNEMEWSAGFGRLSLPGRTFRNDIIVRDWLFCSMGSIEYTFIYTYETRWFVSWSSYILYVCPPYIHTLEQRNQWQ